eukprot:CAMPEP_0202783696 /NCGR_PEP_ID=MMETSP1388-20130828/64938_1 /ASSEMBLY_ACC=CAM_ASM_000864 /TAXON_ID=37098 /ORGANISM="Isochrysis sp, Strain CCMP1244" /LENGTH=100 /DNA_ID=CAMNT_0049453171 /DNA_START=30 /DNA_END=332 /DNA_ORIENTATION=-
MNGRCQYGGRCKFSHVTGAGGGSGSGDGDRSGGGGGAAAALLLRRAPFGSAACGAPWEDRAEVLWEQGSGGWEEPERGGALEEGLAGANGGGEEREESDC